MYQIESTNTLYLTGSPFNWHLVTEQLIVYLCKQLHEYSSELLREYERQKMESKKIAAGLVVKQTTTVSDRDSAESVNLVGDINRENDVKIVNELFSLLPQTEVSLCKENLQNAKDYCQRIIFPEISRSESVDVLWKLLGNSIETYINSRLLIFLINKFEKQLMTILPLMALHGVYNPGKSIRSEQSIVVPENALLTCGKNQWDRIDYIGFAKINTCFGLFLRHGSSGRTALIHMSNALGIKRIILKIFNNFSDVIKNDNQFEARIIGGFREEMHEINVDESTRFLGYFLIRFLAYAGRENLKINFRSMDCFETLTPYREWNAHQTKDITVGCLFNRDGVPVLFNNQLLKQVPYTNIGNSVIVDEAGRRYAIWWYLMRSLGTHGADVCEIYNDVIHGFNQKFLTRCEKAFRTCCITKLIEILYNLKFLGTPNDDFLRNLINQHFDRWFNNYISLFDVPLENRNFTWQLVNYMNILTNINDINAYKSGNIRTDNLPNFYHNIKIEHTFIYFLSRDSCLSQLIIDNLARWCASLMHSVNSSYSQEYIVKCFSDAKVNKWYLLDEINHYLLKFSGGDLVKTLLHTPIERMSEMIKQWQNEKLSYLIEHQFINKLVTKVSVIDMGTIELIRTMLLNKGAELLNYFHPRAIVVPSITKLIDEIAAIIKWEINSDVNSIISNVSKSIQKWFDQVYITPTPHSVLEQQALLYQLESPIIRHSFSSK